jgi:hypothetical protein
MSSWSQPEDDDDHLLTELVRSSGEGGDRNRHASSRLSDQSLLYPCDRPELTGMAPLDSGAVHHGVALAARRQSSAGIRVQASQRVTKLGVRPRIRQHRGHVA